MENRDSSRSEAKDLSELVILLSSVNGHLLKKDYYNLRDVYEMSVNPAISNDIFNTVLINTYLDIVNKINDPSEYLQAGKINGLDKLEEVRVVMLDYITSNGISEMLYQSLKMRMQNNPFS